MVRCVQRAHSFLCAPTRVATARNTSEFYSILPPRYTYVRMLILCCTIPKHWDFESPEGKGFAMKLTDFITQERTETDLDCEAHEAMEIGLQDGAQENLLSIRTGGQYKQPPRERKAWLSARGLKDRHVPSSCTFTYCRERIHSDARVESGCYHDKRIWKAQAIPAGEVRRWS